MIPLQLEPQSIIREFGNLKEHCIFCSMPTRLWHTTTNTPVCAPCGHGKSVSDLIRKRKEAKNNPIEAAEAAAIGANFPEGKATKGGG